MEIPPGLFCAALLVLGLVLGSFYNVCIYRLPQEESIVWPGSMCPHCRHPLSALDNLPLVSFLLLRGSCRYCHGPISYQYPLVELLNTLATVLIGWKFGLSWALFQALVLFGALLVVSFIDLAFLADRVPGLVVFPDRRAIRGRSVVAPGRGLRKAGRKRRHGRRGHQIIGHDRGLPRLARGFSFHFGRFLFRNSGGSWADPGLEEGPRLSHSFRPLSFFRGSDSSFLRHISSELVSRLNPLFRGLSKNFCQKSNYKSGILTGVASPWPAGGGPSGPDCPLSQGSSNWNVSGFVDRRFGQPLSRDAWKG
jgi:hypothetical protein